MLVVWISNYVLILLGNLSVYWLWIAAVGFGIVSLLLLLNIGHDAVHHAISGKRWVNKLFSLTFNLVGGNAYSWYLKHNVAHHRYTSMEGADMDLDTGPLLRVSPLAPYRPHYRYQHLYAPAVYLFSSLALLFYVDFAMLRKVRPGRRKAKPAEWAILIATKCFYLTYTLLVPCLVLGVPVWQAMVGFLTLHGVAGLLIALIFQPSHYVPGMYFTGGKELLRKNWVRHQLATKADIAPRSRLANFLLGGLNTNTIHHIFPGICHVHYIPLSNILKQTAPGARFVYIHRNPFDVYYSNLRFWQVTEGYSFQRVTAAERAKIILSTYRQLLWAYLQQKEAIPENKLIEVRYEALAADPLGQLRTLYGHLGLDFTPVARKAVRQYLDGEGDFKPQRYPYDDHTVSTITHEWAFSLRHWAYPPPAPVIQET